MNFLNLNKKAVDIIVYDSKNRVVYSETVKGIVLVNKVFNFKDAEKDNYIVSVKNSNGSYYQRIKID